MRNLFIFLILVSGLWWWTSPPEPEHTPEPIPAVVSWYGGYFHGKTTANGEIFDTLKMTAASPDLPFGTVLRLVNVENNKEITVYINDRGPFKMDHSGKVIVPLEAHPVRALDLSLAAFKAIADKDKGLAKVNIFILDRK